MHLFASYQQDHMIMLCQSINTGPLAVDNAQLPQCTLYHLPVRTTSFLCLILAIQLAKLQLLLAMALAQSLDFALNIVLTFLSLLVVVLPSLPLSTFVMYSASSALRRLTLLLMWPKHLGMSPTNPSLSKLCTTVSRWLG